MKRTRLFHSVVIVGAGLLANCDKHAAPPAAGSATKPADAAAPPADAAVDAPADAAVDAPVDAATPVKPRPKKVIEIKKPPPNHVRIMIMRPGPPKPPQIMEGQ